MSKIVLYSGGQTQANRELHVSLVKLVGAKKNISITYIPSSGSGAGLCFRKFVKKYSKFGVETFHQLIVDEPVSKANLELALASDIIYLDGGNTFYFLKFLRKSGMLRHLKRFDRRGGVLAGLSAGAILMTPNIGLAGYPDYDADENDVEIEDLRSLDLTTFEFYPHYEGTRREIQSLKKYSKKSSRPIYAVADGSGIVINGSNKTFVGTVDLYYNGNSFPLS